MAFYLDPESDPVALSGPDPDSDEVLLAFLLFGCVGSIGVTLDSSSRARVDWLAYQSGGRAPGISVCR